MFRALFLDTFTTNNQPTDTEIMPIRKKRIRFDNKVSIYLIPFSTEYNADLWYESIDYECFHVAYSAKIRVIMERHKTDWKTACDILNKTSIFYDESFFLTEN